MKRLLLVVACVAIFASCQKEMGRAPNDGETRITSLTVNAPALTRVATIAGTGVGAGSSDQILWQEGDQLTFWEVIETANADGKIPMQAYDIKDGGEKLFFTLSGGAGTKSATFSANGLGLDESKLYTCTHATVANRVTTDMAAKKKLFKFNFATTHSITTGDPEKAVRDGMTFGTTGLVFIEGGEIQLGKFIPMMAIFELHIKNSAFVANFNMKSIKIKGLGTGSSSEFGNFWEVSINTAGDPQIGSGSGLAEFTANLSDPTLITSEGETVIRIPANTRQLKGPRKLIFTIIDEDDKKVVFETTKPVTGDVLAFPHGVTQVINIEIPTDPS